MAKLIQQQQIIERIEESGISNLAGLPASKTTKHLIETGLCTKFSMTTCDGWVGFFSAGFHTIYKRNGRVLELVQLLGEKTFSDHVCTTN